MSIFTNPIASTASMSKSVVGHPFPDTNVGVSSCIGSRDNTTPQGCIFA
jgi:hypothetical protein